MGFVKSLTEQNDSTVSVDPNSQSNQYLPGANTALTNALSGYGQFNQNLAAQQGLAQQYQQIASGQGPNPAQAMLNQQTGMNVANQAALAAGQRGSSANTGLVARQAAQQGANLQQQAVGQGATMQAQQSLNALQGLGGLYGNIGNQVTSQQNANNSLFNTAQGAQANQINENLAAQEAQAGIAQANANTAQSALSGLASGSGSAATSLGKASLTGSSGSNAASGGVAGKDFSNYDDGGVVSNAQAISGGFNNATSNNLGTPGNGPKSQAGQYLKAMSGKSSPTLDSSESAPPSGAAKSLVGLMAMSKGGKAPAKVKAMLSPGEEYLSPKQASMVAKGKADPMAGKRVPGQAKVPGDSLQNDTIPATLEKGGVVVKRSVMATHDPKKVAAFVQAVMAKSGAGKQHAK